jgi:hypothetical protein
MYDSHGLDLYTMYDSYDVYLLVLWIICMFKFSRCRAVIFYNFFLFNHRFFLKILIGFCQNPSEKVIDLSVKSDDNSAIPNSGFQNSTVPLLSTMRFG